MMIRKATFGVMMAASFALAGQAAAQNLLTNPGFEDAGLSGGDQFGAAGWSDFGGGTFTVHGPSVLAPVGANSGDHALKLFGTGSGVFQQFDVSPGEVANGSVVIMNFSGDQVANGQIGAVNIEWIQADGVTQSAITPFISNPAVNAATPTDQWIEYTITGVAPTDAAFARFVLITGDFAPGGVGGAPFYDDAYFEIIPEPGSLALLGLGGLALLRRRR